MKFLIVVTILISLTVYAYDPDYDEPDSEIAYNDSWKLGTPDNIPETEVIIMDDSGCGCPR